MEPTSKVKEAFSTVLGLALVIPGIVLALVLAWLPIMFVGNLLDDSDGLNNDTVALCAVGARTSNNLMALADQASSAGAWGFPDKVRALATGMGEDFKRYTGADSNVRSQVNNLGVSMFMLAGAVERRDTDTWGVANATIQGAIAALDGHCNT